MLFLKHAALLEKEKLSVGNKLHAMKIIQNVQGV